MLCAHCGRAEATVQVKELSDNQISELRLCAACAQADKPKADPASAPIAALLAALGLHASPPLRGEKCAGCGRLYSEFQKSGMLGCARCYRSFAQPLEKILEEIHGTCRHTGKAPALSPQSEIKKIKEDLDRAVRDESFEKAAKLRDRLRKLERP